jgi:hypothetical protein
MTRPPANLLDGSSSSLNSTGAPLGIGGGVRPHAVGVVVLHPFCRLPDAGNAPAAGARTAPPGRPNVALRAPFAPLFRVYLLRDVATRSGGLGRLGRPHGSGQASGPNRGAWSCWRRCSPQRHSNNCGKMYRCSQGGRGGAAPVTAAVGAVGMAGMARRCALDREHWTEQGVSLCEYKFQCGRERRSRGGGAARLGTVWAGGRGAGAGGRARCAGSGMRSQHPSLLGAAAACILRAKYHLPPPPHTY